jgi:uncharacterized damage-inducible protein DinB
MSTVAPTQSLIELLCDLGSLVDRLDDMEYTMPARGRSSGSIGGHVRHCLDHVSALIAATTTGVCAYDRRARGTDVETNRHAAMREVARLTTLIAQLTSAILHSGVDVETQLDRAGSLMISRSSIGRELAFVMSHTVHHHAIIAQMLQARGVFTGNGFGLAPSTPTERESLACAR